MKGAKTALVSARRERRIRLVNEFVASSVSLKEALLTFLFILLLAIVALIYLVPPAVVPASAPVTDFSAERAVGDLKVIAREPHPTGSIANARVRDYIVEQINSAGLKPEVQKSAQHDEMGYRRSARTAREPYKMLLRDCPE